MIWKWTCWHLACGCGFLLMVKQLVTRERYLSLLFVCFLFGSHFPYPFPPLPLPLPFFIPCAVHLQLHLLTLSKSKWDHCISENDWHRLCFNCCFCNLRELITQSPFLLWLETQHLKSLILGPNPRSGLVSPRPLGCSFDLFPLLGLELVFNVWEVTKRAYIWFSTRLFNLITHFSVYKCGDLVLKYMVSLSRLI